MTTATRPAEHVSAVRTRVESMPPGAHVTHARQSPRSAALVGRLKDRDALDTVGPKEQIEPKQVKESHRSGTCEPGSLA